MSIRGSTIPREADYFRALIGGLVIIYVVARLGQRSVTPLRFVTMTILHPKFATEKFKVLI